MKGNNNEIYIRGQIKEKLSLYPIQPIRYYKNIVYGRRKSHPIGEIDFLAEYTNFYLLFEIKSSEKHRKHAKSQLERACNKYYMIQNKEIHKFFAWKNKSKEMQLEWII